MNASLLVVIGIGLFILAYRFYGDYLDKKLEVDRTRKTPAHTLRDGVDYIPAKSPVLLGHHFASIAGAGPILGPIIASIFGWVPVFLWIVIGGICFGAVHDMSSIIASIRHKGLSIGHVIEEYLGYRGKQLFLIFSYLTMILVIAVFSRIVATTFITIPAIATSSLLFMILAVFFGFAIYRKNMPLLPTSAIGIVLLSLCIFIGTKFPFTVYTNFTTSQVSEQVRIFETQGKILPHSGPAEISRMLEAEGFPELAQNVNQAAQKAHTLWIVILLLYVFVAATTPVWILLQPRDYLNSFLLYALLIGGVVGVLFARPEIVHPQVTHFKTNLGLLFPVLFVTVACGAISGFHSLVASGTTAKQLNKESDAKIVGYGGMLIESLLAILALITAVTMFRGRYDVLTKSGDFITIFAEGIGAFLSRIPLMGIDQNTAISFSGLAVSAFALTSLDTCTRLARFAFQEFCQPKDKAAPKRFLTNRFSGTAITVIVSALFIFSGSSNAIWPIFGSANQLLAALALLAVTTWLTHMKKTSWFTKIPLIFMYSVTLTALVTLVIQNFRVGHYSLAIVGLFLIIVAVLLAVQAIPKFLSVKTKISR